MPCARKLERLGDIGKVHEAVVHDNAPASMAKMFAGDTGSLFQPRQVVKLDIEEYVAFVQHFVVLEAVQQRVRRRHRASTCKRRRCPAHATAVSRKRLEKCHERNRGLAQLLHQQFPSAPPRDHDREHDRASASGIQPPSNSLCIAAARR